MRITAIFTNDAGALVDPTTPLCTVLKPDGTVKQENVAMAQIGTGTYRAEVETEWTADIGYWKVRVWGYYDGTRIAETERVQVLDVI